jgi:hypothetical protein
MLRGYFDDSGTHDPAWAVVWGGVVGGKENFDYLDSKWRELLAAPCPGKPPLNQFRLSKCKARRGQFETYSTTEMDYVCRQFRQIIVDSGVAPVGYGVDVRAWNRLVVGDQRRLMGAPERLAFGQCAKAMIEMAEAYDALIDVRFDIGRELQVTEMIEAARSLFPETQRLASFNWVACEAATGLQAADTIANEFYRYACRWVDDRNADAEPSLRSLLENVEHSYLRMNGQAEISNLLTKMPSPEQSARWRL